MLRPLLAFDILLLSAVAGNVAGNEQAIFEPQLNRPSVAPFVFNGLSSLLTQWPNTIHGNGHSIVPGILHPFTLLYHAREDATLPPSPEWLAWDPEMSYAIMVPRGGKTYLATYRTIRPANIVYFDGMSAAWGPGWLDSQHMFIYGITAEKNFDWWDDYGRAEKLCEWAKPRDIDGIVRMNAGFEVIWCDFDSPKLQLVSHLNITPPGTPEGSSPRFPHPLAVDDEDPPERPPRRGPGRWPGRPRMSELALTGTLEWVRAASHRSFSPQHHLTLFPSGMISFYHPRLTSLREDRADRPMHSHRLINISSADAMSVVQEMDDVIARFRAGDRGSGMDWGGTALGIVEYWGDRISHMHALLLNASNANANATALLPAIRTLAYTLVNPYMQPGVTPNASGWELFFGISHVISAFGLDANVTALERCTRQTTGFLSQLESLTSQEIFLQDSVETVLGRLCNDFGIIFAQSSDLVQGTSKAALGSMIDQWRRQIEKLMEWLDWSVWLRCQDVCERDYVCSTPMWPIAWFFGRPWGARTRLRRFPQA
ncbi:hypothetical protein C8F01DRAFT_1010492 [Mycena amicta]|nr:hypothetical protein C8F01DRAFT_1010492 [Mycena amicta]